MSRKGWITKVAYVAGFLLLSYPLINSFHSTASYKEAVSDYSEEVASKSEEEKQTILDNARRYNDVLFQSQGAIVDNADNGILSDDSYNGQLLQSDTGVMGSIEIPKIDVDLPIFHGTGDDVLSVGVGHQEGTSLPIGGENTHSCLTGHRGVPGSSLFTRLDEISEGDLFFLDILGDTLAYKVHDIQVFTPDEAAEFVTKIDPGKDIVSLVTCTPYGLNTHRLVVTGERVPYEKATYEGIQKSIPSWRELLFMALPFILVAIIVVLKIKDRREEKNAKKDVV